MTTSEEILHQVADERNMNLTGPQHELLAWHYRWGHVSMNTIQQLIRPKNFAPPEQDCLAKTVVVQSKFQTTHTCHPPQCASCNLAKAARTSIQTKTTLPSTDGSIKASHLKPGDCISMDQIVCPQRGRTLSSFKSTITGGTIYIGHASGYIKFVGQSRATAAETLLGKAELERGAHDLGFRLKRFVTDNGIFNSHAFWQDILRKNQTIRFCGVGAHHQNGVAERGIKTICGLVRAMLIHAALRWPDSHDLTLWPLCLQHAVFIWNRIPLEDGLSPEEKWTSTKSDHHHLRSLHPWGCPAYVPDPTLQDGKKLPKWKPRSRQGRFVGYSPSHASSVALVLNCKTRYISPQFHLLFDDFFSTVKGVDVSLAPDLESFDWETFIQHHRPEKYYDEDDELPPLHWDDESVPQREKARPPPSHSIDDIVTVDDDNDVCSLPRSEPPIPRIQHGEEAIRLPDLEEGMIEPDISNPGSLRPDDTGAVDVGTTHPLEADHSGDDPHEDLSEGVNPPSMSQNSTEQSQDEAQDSTLDRSQRARIKNRRYYNEDFVNLMDAELNLRQKRVGYDRDKEFINSIDWGTSIANMIESSCSTHDRKICSLMEYHDDPSLGALHELSPYAFSARAGAADTPNWNEAINGDNAEGFWGAMLKEITTLNDLDAWTLVPRTPDMKVLPSTWAFKIKRYPVGLIRKLKSRICVMGNRQTDVDPFECYAPVVAWSTVHTMLILSVILNLHSVQVDYTSAFCQAKVHDKIYVMQPRGWRTLNRMGLKQQFKQDHVMKLNRSLYGLKQSPKNFFKHLKERLEHVGVTQSSCDPCLFLKGDVTCLVYVDDCLFFAKDKDMITKTIEDLQEANMDLLGVLMTKNEDGSVTLTQTGLISRILLALGLTNSNGTRTPAPKAPLPRDVDGEPFSEDYNYASVVGMMMYLACNSRPDIAFAVNQCARHTHHPTALHGKYLKQIGRYLQSTKDKGMIINPTRSNDSLYVECYADADFAGLWGREDVHDPHCVKSRSGYLILINGCPILWKSKLQTETAWSTMEAEYVALSTACRDVIPIIRLVEERSTQYGLNADGRPSMKSTIYEDNEGALKLANTELPRMTPRSKHYGTKYHWFREHVEKGLIEVVPIDTKNQLADVFTKGLGFESFLRLRKRLVGW